MSQEFELQLLAVARVQYDEAKARLDAARKAFDEQHAALIAEVEAKRSNQETQDRKVRELAGGHFANDGIAKPLEGIEIKMVERAEFRGEEASKWAFENARALLSLDTKAYDKLLREVRSNKALTAVFGSMPGEVIKEAKVFIASDLSAYLPKKEESHD